jgi:DNA-binding transcriptional LysR family regulator
MDLGPALMEMHQVRYFLAVARTLNFTRAAEECNVAQPSLTRAIRQLEDELGGDLFRRERPHAQLTELGQRMQPLLQQCYNSALGARSLASSIKSGEVGSLRIALSATIEIALLMPYILELRKHFQRLEVKLLRGTASQVAEFMKSGSAELAIASSLGNAWDRLDTWPLFTEGFVLVVAGNHHLAECNSIQLSDLRDEALIMRCEEFESLANILRSQDFAVDRAHEVASEHDLEVFLERGLGIAFAPQSVLFSNCVKRVLVSGLDLRRTVSLYGVAGRQRTPVANMIMKMLRAADWSRYST